MLGIPIFDQRHDPQRLHIVVEPAPWRHLVGQHALPRMPEGRMPQIMGQRDRLGQILIEPERPRDGPRDLAHLQRMGQPGTKMLPFMMEKHLGFVLQSPECRGMDDPIPVTLELVPRRAGAGPMDASP